MSQYVLIFPEFTTANADHEVAWEMMEPFSTKLGVGIVRLDAYPPQGILDAITRPRRWHRPVSEHERNPLYLFCWFQAVGEPDFDQVWYSVTNQLDQAVRISGRLPRLPSSSRMADEDRPRLSLVPPSRTLSRQSI